MWQAVATIGGVLSDLFDQPTIVKDRLVYFVAYTTRCREAAPSSLALWSPDRFHREPLPGVCDGVDWVALVEQEEDTEQGTLTRRISSLREVGKHYRRDDQVRRQRLPKSSEIAGELRGSGFRVRTVRSYGR